MNRGLRSANISTYQTRQDMKARCYNKNCHNYQNYGARGISVCDSWLESFENFFADMGAKSGVKGVSLEKKTGLWKAYIKVGGKQTHLGRFPTLEEAAEARRIKAAEAHGEFARETE